MNARRSLPRLSAALLALAVLVVAGCSADTSGSKYYQFSLATAVGSVIPADQRKPVAPIEAALLDGKGNTTLAERKGKPVVVAFWASWCGPCKVEMPQLQQEHTSIGGKVDFLGVNTQDQKSTARAFVDTNDITFPVVYDQPGEVAAKFGNIPGSLPFTVLLDSQQRVAAVYIQRYAPKDLDTALAKLVAES